MLSDPASCWDGLPDPEAVTDVQRIEYPGSCAEPPRVVIIGPSVALEIPDNGRAAPGGGEP